MRVVQINATCGAGSTGKICVGISRCLSRHSIDNRILYFSGTSDFPQGVRCSDNGYIKRQALMSRVLGNNGFTSNAAAKRVIGELEPFQPDAVHLHNIHGHSLNIELLFRYLKEKNIKLFWTFHDCWAFTGYCSYFDMLECDKWKTGCEKCPGRKKYSWFFDRSSELYRRKKELFSGLDLTVVTPSHWLAGLVKQSFLKDYPVRVIHNGIDLSVFRPSPSDFRRENGISDEKFMLLGVSFEWERRKGLDVFIELSKQLDPQIYQIVLVGTNAQVDASLPDNIISIHRTKDQQELAKIYSAADLFVNPTREENYPTVNLEAVACGTPVLSFNTGGSAEMLSAKTGRAVERGNTGALINAIGEIRLTEPYSTEDCVRHAAANYAQEELFESYAELYQSRF